jgi:hypothetical protein
VSQAAWAKPAWLGLGAFACVGALGLCCVSALHFGWLEPKWSGVLGYVWPLVLWQGCACLSAAFSHRPFQTQAANKYSWACMSLALIQALILLGPILLKPTIDAELHITVFVVISCLGLLATTQWMARLR